MPQALSYVTLLVRDYDEAIEYFATRLGFSVLADTKLDDQKRWVLVAPVGADVPSLLLAEATTPEQTACIGNQTGGRVSFFLQTDDFARDYRDFRARGVVFLETPRSERYGTVAVFEDLYGNKWDLLQLSREIQSTAEG